MAQLFQSKAVVEAIQNREDENADECLTFLQEKGIDFSIADTNTYDIYPRVTGAQIWGPGEWLVYWQTGIARVMTDDMFHVRWRATNG